MVAKALGPKAFGPGQPARFVSYVRVSTERQGRSGLGLDAQREAVAGYVARAQGELVGEFREVESGKRSDRPQLKAALNACRAEGAVLVIAKLDRLARNTMFLLSVIEGVGERGVAFCDLPDFPPGPTGKFFLTLLAAVAELEAGLISQRTRAALAAARKRGVRLGNPHLVAGSAASAQAARTARRLAADRHALATRPYIDQARGAGAVSLREVATVLERRGVQAPGGGAGWTPEAVRRVILRTRKLAGV